jgi:ATP-dependent RNA helicase RhlB
MTDSHLSELRFDTLKLDEQLRAGIRDAGFELCTPIQALALPIALDQRDVAGQAQTGTGKTAAFLIAAYQRLLNLPAASDDDGARQPRIFILAPTRELAVQIANDAELLGGHTGFKIGLAFGGTGYEQQRRTIQDGIDLLIGTPGGRGRPHVRPRLHQGHSLPAATAAATRQAPEYAVFCDLVAKGHGTRL